MNDQVELSITVSLPAGLVARVEELKQDRAEDRAKSIQDLLREWCEDYVAVRELARRERAEMDNINRAYEAQMNDWEKLADWPAALPAVAEERP